MFSLKSYEPFERCVLICTFLLSSYFIEILISYNIQLQSFENLYQMTIKLKCFCLQFEEP